VTTDKAPRRWKVATGTKKEDLGNGDVLTTAIMSDVGLASDYDALAAELRIQDQANEILTRQLAETKAERDELKERLDVFRNREYEAKNTDELKAELSREEKKVEKLNEIRRHHAWHNEDCLCESSYDAQDCDCGFEKRVAELEAIDKESEGAR